MKKKKIKKFDSHCIANIFTTYNNTIITVSDLKGNTLYWASAGTSGLKGSRKSSLFAAQMVAEEIIEKAQEFGITEFDILINGCGKGREIVIETLSNEGFTIGIIKDITGVPYNGCRPPKKRKL